MPKFETKSSVSRYSDPFHTRRWTLFSWPHDVSQYTSRRLGLGKIKQHVPPKSIEFQCSLSLKSRTCKQSQYLKKKRKKSGVIIIQFSLSKLLPLRKKGFIFQGQHENPIHRKRLIHIPHQSLYSRLLKFFIDVPDYVIELQLWIFCSFQEYFFLPVDLIILGPCNPSRRAGNGSLKGSAHTNKRPVPNISSTILHFRPSSE